MIRLLHPSDYTHVLPLLDAANERFHHLELPVHHPDLPLSASTFEEAVHDGLAFGAEDAGVLVGVVLASSVGDAAVLEQVSVLSEHANNGLGAALVDRLSEAAGEIALHSVIGTFFRTVPWQAPYFERLGFSPQSGSRGASLLMAEASRGFVESERVAMVRVVEPASTQVFTTDEASDSQLAECRELMGAAFETFDDTDWEHALGGTHAVVRHKGRIVAHASAVPRQLYLGSTRRAAAYIEAVGVHPEFWRQGYGSRVMRALTVRCRTRFDLLSLSSSIGAFYERLGWRLWQGSTFVRREDGLELTPEDDGGVWVMDGIHPVTQLDGLIGCEERQGDVW